MDLRDLYQEVIIDHNRNPRNFRTIADANHSADGHNPLCGDKITVYLQVDDEGIIKDASFQGSGCAISVASASMMTDYLIGKNLNDAQALFEGFHAMVMDETAAQELDLGKLEALGGVKDFPARVKCATLCWHTMKAALTGDAVVSTE